MHRCETGGQQLPAHRKCCVGWWVCWARKKWSCIKQDSGRTLPTKTKSTTETNFLDHFWENADRGMLHKLISIVLASNNIPVLFALSTYAWRKPTYSGKEWWLEACLHPVHLQGTLHLIRMQITSDTFSIDLLVCIWNIIHTEDSVLAAVFFTCICWVWLAFCVLPFWLTYSTEQRKVLGFLILELALADFVRKNRTCTSDTFMLLAPAKLCSKTF